MNNNENTNLYYYVLDTDCDEFHAHVEDSNGKIIWSCDLREDFNDFCEEFDVADENDIMGIYDALCENQILLDTDSLERME